MKRLVLLIILLVLFTSTLLAVGELLFDVAIVGLDIMVTAGKGPVTVTLEEEKGPITIGGTGIKPMRRTFEEHDFSTLGYEERLKIYNRLSVPIVWPIVKNITIGFGNGSVLQYDSMGALTGAVLDGASAITLSVGLGIFIGLISVHPDTFSDHLPLFSVGVDLMVAGMIGFGASRIIQGIIPAVYGLKYNKVLREGLGLEKDRSDALRPALGFAPLPTRDGRLQWQIAARIPLQ